MRQILNDAVTATSRHTWEPNPRIVSLSMDDKHEVRGALIAHDVTPRSQHRRSDWQHCDSNGDLAGGQATTIDGHE